MTWLLMPTDTINCYGLTLEEECLKWIRGQFKIRLENTS